MQTLEIIGQIVGFVGTAVSLVTYQWKNRNGILACLILSSFLFTSHFILLGNYSGAALNFVGLIRAVLFFYRGQKKWVDSIVWLPVFILISAGAVALTWEGPISLLPMTGMILTTFAQYSTSARTVRLLTLCNSPCWLTYNVIVGSLAGIVTEIMVSCSIVVALFRYDIRKKPVSQTEDTQS